MRTGLDTSRLIRATLQRNMFFKFMLEEPEAALDEDSRTGHERAIARPLHKSTKLHQAIEILLCAFTVLDLGHQGGQVNRAHAAGWTLTAAFPFEEIRKLQRLRYH